MFNLCCGQGTPHSSRDDTEVFVRAVKRFLPIQSRDRPSSCTARYAQFLVVSKRETFLPTSEADGKAAFMEFRRRCA